MATDSPRHDLVPDDLVDRFVAEGYVRLDDVFPRSVADECRAILWRSLDASPDDPSTWTRPVVRVPGRADAPLLPPPFDRRWSSRGCSRRRPAGSERVHGSDTTMASSFFGFS